jgi:hypothetical protein
MLSQGSQDLLDVLQVLCPCLAQDDDCIQIDHQERFCECLQDIIHHPHEFCWSIG